MQNDTILDTGKMKKGMWMLFSHPRFRPRFIRRLVIVMAVIAVVIGAQMYWFYSNIMPQITMANSHYLHLVDERLDWKLTQKIISTLDQLKRMGMDKEILEELNLIQTEFQSFLVNPAEGLRTTLTRLSSLKTRITDGGELVNQIERDMIQVNVWHHDHYGDVVAAMTNPGIHLWPSSSLIKWYSNKGNLDTIRFNRALYQIMTGGGANAQATLGELRTQLSDSALRAKVLYTEGRLLYGMSSYERSIEVVQESLRVDPSMTLARRFLEYQLSRGPDEEVEEDDEVVTQPGFTSGGGGTLF